MNSAVDPITPPIDEAVPQDGASQPAVRKARQSLNSSTGERKLPKMVVMLIALLVGIVIGVIFKSLKLPVPVPHDFAGIVGLIGMFVGSALVDVVSNLLAK